MEKVLISAPYMHIDRKSVEALMLDLPYEFHWIDVKERLEEDQLLSVIGDYQAIICGDDRITKNVIDAATQLKCIVKWGTGIDSIDKEYAESKGISVCRTPNAFTVPVADSTIGYMLADVRTIFYNTQIIRSGGWSKPQGYTLSEMTVGIIGFGNIGKAVAKRLIPFEVKVIAYDIETITDEDAQILHAHKAGSLDQIFEESDIITLHCDLNSSSRHIINELSLSKVKRKPLIINTARGPLIDEKSLIKALENGIVRGAALDVFEEEPLAKDNPLRFMTNVMGACHNSNSSPQKWINIHKNSIRMLHEELTK